MLDIVNAFVDLGTFDKVELFAGEINIRPTIPHKSIKIIKTIRYSKKSIIYRFLTWIISFVHLLIIIWTRSNKFELFLVSNPPLTTFVPLLTRKKFSLLIYDLYPDTLLGFMNNTKNSIVIKLWKKANFRVFKNAKKIYTISNDMKTRISEYINKDKITVIYNWVHTEHLKPVPKESNSFLKNLQLNDKFVVLYSGNLGITHDIDVLIDVANMLKHENSIQFIIIGEGAKKKIIKEKIMMYNLVNCILLPFQDANILPFSMAAADIGVVTTEKNQSSLSIPSKTYSYLAVGSVLLCLTDRNSELAQMVETKNVGKCFSKDDVSQIAEFISFLKNNVNELNKIKLNSQILSKTYSPSNTNFYIETYNENN